LGCVDVSGLEGALVSVKPRLLFLVTEDWYFWSHRLDLARAARDAGMDVLVATRVDAHGERIRAEGFTLIPIRLLRSNRRPLRELAAIVELVLIYRRARPHIVHHVAMKPVLYGSFAAWFTSVPAVVNAFAGLGYTFIAADRRAKWRRLLITRALRWALRASSSRVIFQNDDDRDLFVRESIAVPDHTVVIRGSGVDVKRYTPRAEADGEPVVVLPARMLWDKGVGEFVEAARLLRQRGLRVRCVLAGMVDTHNPAMVSEAHLRAWQDEGVVEWVGHQEDMPVVFARAHVVVLPSYREGLPRVLLEAAACARSIVATDVPGCREIVRHGDNGLLVPPRDPLALAQAIATLVEDPALRVRMGARGRQLAVNEFSSERITGEVLALYQTLLGDRRPVLSLSAST
jgi:glycosyltransferase involved in cell wall biosynthesis